jgi:hypothetical protein
MTVRYAVFLLGTLVALQSATAQGVVTLTNEDGQVVNGTVVFHPSAPTNVRDTVSLFAELTGANAAEVNVRRYEIWTVGGTRNYFCWGVCYTAVNAGQQPSWISQHPLLMSPSVEYNNFHAYYEPNQNAGTARFRYVWYRMSTPNAADSSWVDIDFGGAVGLPEGGSPAAVNLASWPNPSMGSDITITHSIGQFSAGAELVIYNVLGDRVMALPIREKHGSQLIRTGELGAGVYFANIEQQGRILATRRLVVSN